MIESHPGSQLDPACSTGIGTSACSLIRDTRPETGRRLYIHEHSFEILAHSSEIAAGRVYRILCQIIGCKILHHHLTETAIPLGLVSPAKAEKAESSVVLRWMDEITTRLREIGFRPLFSGDTHSFRPLLAAEERIAATCYDVQYYTLATSPAAAERMYADTSDIQLVKRAVRQKSSELDLTIVKGRSLAFIDATRGVGDRQAQRYRELFGKPATIPVEQLNAAKIEAAQSAVHEIDSALAAAFTHPTPSEYRVIRNLKAACEMAMSKGILRPA